MESGQDNRRKVPRLTEEETPFPRREKCAKANDKSKVAHHVRMHYLLLFWIPFDSPHALIDIAGYMHSGVAPHCRHVSKLVSPIMRNLDRPWDVVRLMD